MSKPSRKVLRCGIWTMLVVSAILDGALGEAAISGYGCVFAVRDGHFVPHSAEPELWPLIFGFVVFQGLLVYILIRLREPGSDQPTMVVPSDK